MASIDSYLPDEGRAVWRRDRKPIFAKDSQAVRHVVIRGTEVITHPSAHVVYRIDVLMEHSHWYICRRYSEFHDLHKKLVRKFKLSKDLLPPKKMSGNLSDQLIAQRRQQLEQYLQQLINSEPQVSQCNELLTFLDVPAHDVARVSELLARQLYAMGDKLLEQGTPIALTINDLHCITKRLRLPMDLQHSTDIAGDLGHLYSFLHQIKSLKVVPPPQPSSVTRMAFEITPFKSLEILKIEHVPLSQVSGLVRVQQQLKRLSFQNTMKTIRELLIDSVEEKRSVGQDSRHLTESWRLVATARFTANRVVVQPWNNLTLLNISHNKISHLDDSLQVLPVLKELNVSYNRLVSVDLQHLCLPFLQTLNLSHNHIAMVTSRSLVLESLQHLNISHNELTDLSYIKAFIGILTLNISYNNISTKDFDHLTQLKTLKTLAIKGNPIMSIHVARLVLLAKFMHKSRMVSVDGTEPSSSEQARIHQLTKRYGDDIDRWPVAQSIQPPPLENRKQRAPPSPTPPSPPSVQVSWSVESLRKPFLTGTSPSPSHSVTDTGSTFSGGSFDNPLFSDSAHSINDPINSNPVFPPLNKESPILSRRDEPDGRSDISTEVPDVLVIASTPSPVVLPTPPCTPLSAGDDDTHVTPSVVTPHMISAALEALSHAAIQTTTPSEENQLPGILSQALNNFITEHSSSCATPPSTPQDQDQPTNNPISATDLISALTSTLSAHCGSTKGTDSGIPSVPSSTPSEGLSGFFLLGIQPESILQALNSLLDKEEENDLDEEKEEQGEDDPERRNKMDESMNGEMDENEGAIEKDGMKKQEDYIDDDESTDPQILTSLVFSEEEEEEDEEDSEVIEKDSEEVEYEEDSEVIEKEDMKTHDDDEEPTVTSLVLSEEDREVIEKGGIQKQEDYIDDDESTNLTSFIEEEEGETKARDVEEKNDVEIIEKDGIKKQEDYIDDEDPQILTSFDENDIEDDGIKKQINKGDECTDPQLLTSLESSEKEKEEEKEKIEPRNSSEIPKKYSRIIDINVSLY